MNVSGAPSADTAYVMLTRRTTYSKRYLDEYNGRDVGGAPAPEPDIGKANLVSSEIRPGVHMPVIDLDYPAVLIASSTVGHSHLYIDKELTWVQYKALLDGLHGAGLIQTAWHDNALRDKRSYVRLPHIRKPKPSDPDPKLPAPTSWVPF